MILATEKRVEATNDPTQDVLLFMVDDLVERFGRDRMARFLQQIVDALWEMPN